MDSAEARLPKSGIKVVVDVDPVDML